MKIIRADYIMIGDANFSILRDKAICFDKKIIMIEDASVLQERFPEAAYEDMGKNSLLMPGLINPHVHLEFSANKTTLRYGDFIRWLNSVIKERERLLGECEHSCIEETLESIMISGTTTIGAISSFGEELKACVQTPLTVVYFNEVLGSNPHAVDTLYNDFLGRLHESQSFASSNFIPAISVHSPYSTHFILARKAIEMAKREDLRISTHFMESQAERDWLDKGEGDFKVFFTSFAPESKPVNRPLEFLSLFEGTKTLFTHATKATDEELQKMQSIGSITHCPRSNRLLGNGRLAVEKLQHFTLATDGLSSNDTLSMWDEMRAALMLHHQAPLEQFAKRLIASATRNGSEALHLNKGVLEVGKDADIIMIELPESVEEDEAVALMSILFTKEAKEVFIAGDRVL